MKKACSILFAMVATTLSAWSQASDSSAQPQNTFEAEPQLIFGVSYASATLNPSISTSGLLGFDVGVAFDYQFDQSIGISSGVMYRQGGYTLDATQDEVDSWILLKRLGLPISALVVPAKEPNIIVRAGIEPGLLLSAVNKYKASNGNTGESDLTSSYASFVLSGVLSAHVRWFDFLEVGLAYQRDFVSVQEGTSSTTYLQNVSLQLRFVPNEFDG